MSLAVNPHAIGSLHPDQTPALEAGGAALVSPQVTQGRTGAYHSHFHVLLIVPAKYFVPSSSLYIAQAKRRVMWELCPWRDDRRIVDVRVTENPGEVAKYVTKPGAYLKLAGDGAPRAAWNAALRAWQPTAMARSRRCLKSGVSWDSWKTTISTASSPLMSLMMARVTPVPRGAVPPAPQREGPARLSPVDVQPGHRVRVRSPGHLVEWEEGEDYERRLR
jgi:hypothetical protein